MAGQSKLRGQKAIAFALQAPPEQLKLFYNDLMKKLRKRVKLATDCGIVAGKWLVPHAPAQGKTLPDQYSVGVVV